MNGFSIANVRDRSTPWSRSETRPLCASPGATAGRGVAASGGQPQVARPASGRRRRRRR